MHLYYEIYLLACQIYFLSALDGLLNSIQRFNHTRAKDRSTL